MLCSLFITNLLTSRNIMESPVRTAMTMPATTPVPWPSGDTAVEFLSDTNTPRKYQHDYSTLFSGNDKSLDTSIFLQSKTLKRFKI